MGSSNISERVLDGANGDLRVPMYRPLATGMNALAEAHAGGSNRLGLLV